VELEALEESYRPGYGGLGGRMSHKKCVGQKRPVVQVIPFSGN